MACMGVGAVPDPEGHLQVHGILNGTQIRAEGHLDTGVEGRLEPLSVLFDSGIGAGKHLGGDLLNLQVFLLPFVGRLPGS